MSTEPPIVISITHNYSASAERVFDAWLDPGIITQWMFGHTGLDEEILHLKTDPQAGGQFSFLVRRQSNELNHCGTYLEIDRPRRLIFTWGVNQESGDDSRVTIEITPQGSGCELTLTHAMAPQWAEYAERTKAGWAKMLDALAKALE